jgi:hypothetical protein
MKITLLISGVMLGLTLTAGAFAQTSTPDTPTCPAGTQVTTGGASNNPKLSANAEAGNSGTKADGGSATAADAPPDAARNTAVRVGNGLARLPDGTLCRPLDG